MIEEVELIERINQPRCADALQRFADACERLAILDERRSALLKANPQLADDKESETE